MCPQLKSMRLPFNLIKPYPSVQLGRVPYFYDKSETFPIVSNDEGNFIKLDVNFAEVSSVYQSRTCFGWKLSVSANLVKLNLWENFIGKGFFARHQRLLEVRGVKELCELVSSQFRVDFFLNSFDWHRPAGLFAFRSNSDWKGEQQIYFLGHFATCWSGWKSSMSSRFDSATQFVNCFDLYVEKLFANESQLWFSHIKTRVKRGEIRDNSKKFLPIFYWNELRE